jgi:hypothetical protein
VNPLYAFRTKTCARCAVRAITAVWLVGVGPCVAADLAAHRECECDRLHAHEDIGPSTGSTAPLGTSTWTTAPSGTNTASSTMSVSLQSWQTPFVAGNPSPWHKA